MQATSPLTQAQPATDPREARLKALPLDPPALEPERQPLPISTVQAEWTNTLRRLREACELVECNEVVHPLQLVYVEIRDREDLDLTAIDRILFDNLLLAIRTRTLSRRGTIYFAGEWLWHWRKAVPFFVEKVEPINRLAPWQPAHQWNYRFNLLEADL